jgi:hypothetical protein
MKCAKFRIWSKTFLSFNVIVLMHSLEKWVRKNSIAWLVRSYLPRNRGTWWHGWGTVPQAARSSVRFPIVSLEFFIDIIFQAALRPLREMIARNIFLGVKAAGAWGWQPYHLHVSIVLKSDTLRLLEPSGNISQGRDCPTLNLLRNDVSLMCSWEIY